MKHQETEKNKDIPEYQHPAKKAYTGHGGKGPHFHKFTNRCKWVAKCQTLADFSPRKKASDLYFMRMGENHSLSGWCGNKKQHYRQ
jgi:hypothetical protein